MLHSHVPLRPPNQYLCTFCCKNAFVLGVSRTGIPKKNFSASSICLGNRGYILPLPQILNNGIRAAIRHAHAFVIGGTDAYVMNKIILADNQAIFRAGTAKILAMEDDFRIIAQCPDCERLYQSIDTFRGV